MASRLVASRLACAAVLGSGLAASLLTARFDPVVAEQRWAEDDALRARVESSVGWHRALHAFDIKVEVRDGIARLRGSVDDALERELAGRLAGSVDGIRKVDNNLVVEPERARWLGQHGTVSDSGLDDRVLVLTINAQLRWNRTTRRLALEVDSLGGHVILRGSARSLRERETAERIASRIEGVQTVDNRIAIDSRIDDRGAATLRGIAADIAAVTSDVLISTKIRSGLLFTPGVSGLDLQVITLDGEVMLSGIAANRTELDLAVEIAASVSGVGRVDTSQVRLST